MSQGAYRRATDAECRAFGREQETKGDDHRYSIGGNPKHLVDRWRRHKAIWKEEHVGSK